MIEVFRNKTKYNKGQVFPFLIAIIVMIIIVAMITANLGQIGVFKTDVSNAADAGALAGASILSGALLGFGLKSELMVGEMIVTVAAMIIAICTVVGIPAAIAMGCALIVSGFVNYFQSLEEGKMAWSNAKKSAMQYAFQNAGIDEPRPTFKTFMTKVYGIMDPDSYDNANMISLYNLYYIKGDNPGASENERKKIKQYSQSGFSTFMERTDYWRWGDIKPGRMSPAIVTSGYGWDPVLGTNSNETGDTYKNYPNYVEVEVIGNVMYPLTIDFPGWRIVTAITDWITDHTGIPWWLLWLGGIGWLINMIGFLWFIIPAGLMMGTITENKIVQNTDDNPLNVTVRRYKANNDVGVWNFRYGEVESAASGHAYREKGNEDVASFFLPGLWNFIWGIITGNFDWGNIWDEMTDTEKHLFESEVTAVR